MPNTDHLRFLVIDDNGESRMLLTKSLMRKYPASAVIECQDSATAVAIIGRDAVNAVVAHRTFDHSGSQLVALLRQASQTVPIVSVSGYNRAASARAAGADAFLNYDEWLKIGTVVEDAIKKKASTPGAQPDRVIRLAPVSGEAAAADRKPRSSKGER